MKSDRLTICCIMLMLVRHTDLTVILRSLGILVKILQSTKNEVGRELKMTWSIMGEWCNQSESLITDRQPPSLFIQRAALAVFRMFPLHMCLKRHGELMMTELRFLGNHTHLEHIAIVGLVPIQRACWVLIDVCIDLFQGKGKMRTYWLLGEKTDVYVIWEHCWWQEVTTLRATASYIRSVFQRVFPTLTWNSTL